MAAHGRVLYVWALIALMAVLVSGAGLIALAGTLDDPIVRTRTVDAPLLPAGASVADVESRFADPPVSSVPGQQIGLQGGTCDVRELKDGLLLVCHA